MKSFLQKSVTIVVQENRQSSVINLLLFLQILLIFIFIARVVRICCSTINITVVFPSIKQYYHQNSFLFHIINHEIFSEVSLSKAIAW